MKHAVSPEDTITLNPATPGTAKLNFGMDEAYEGSGVVQGND